MKKCLAAFLIAFPLCAQVSRGSRHLLGTNSPLTAPSGRSARAIAQDFIQTTVAAELSLTPGDVAGMYVAKEYQTAHNGVTHIIYKQQFSGVDVYNAEWVVNIASDGSILNSGGKLFSAPAPGVVLPDTTSAMPAARSAVRHINSKVAKNFFPLITGATSRKNGIRMSGGDLPADLQGELVWFGRNGAVQPAWRFLVTDADGKHRYSTVVDNASQAIMAQHPLTFFQSPAPPGSTVPGPKGLVFERESPQPSPTPGVFLTTAPPVVDRTLQSFAGDPIASPNGWVVGNETRGNNVVAGENLLGTLPVYNPRTTTTTDGVFSFPLQLGAGVPSPLAFTDAANTNLFYWMNRAHDLHYQAGFDEAAGNFQVSNLGRGGTDGDPMYAYSHFGTAARQVAAIDNSFFTTVDTTDGSASFVAMFLAQSNNNDFFTDGSYDSFVMVHEYTHGVSTRLVRQGYDTFQGESMGEGWSDFYGLEFTTPTGAPPDGTYAVGQYFDQSWGSGDFRSRPFSTNMDVNPLTYANLGTVLSYSPEVHAEGEIWVEALWEMRANLIQQFGEAEGRRRTRMLVIDGMKLAVPAPSMVDARDGILLADKTDFKGASQSQIWAAFAKRGLGALAFSNGGDTVHVVTSFDLPSSTGQLKFYDNPIVTGEPAIIVLQDSSLTQPTVRVTLTSSSGDLEDVALFKNGYNYVGGIGTTGATSAHQDGILSLATGDYITAFYTHFGAPGNQQASTTIGTRQQYTRTTLQPSFTFTKETPLNLFGDTFARVDLPFQFPYFSNKYGYALVHQNGLISFDLPVNSSCTDGGTFATINGMAPLFANLTVDGFAQSREGIYMSQSVDSVTFHWVAETVNPLTSGHPVNFSATLFNNGAIQFSYDPKSNADLNFDATYYGCGLSPVDGLSNGHGFDIAGLIRVIDTSNGFGGTFNWDPPFGNSTVPVVKLESPTDGQQVQGILQVTGIAYDTQSPITRIDAYIDGVIRRTTTPSVVRTDFCTGANAGIRGCPLVGFSVPLDVSGMNLLEGQHNLSLRVTNSRGGFTNAAPVSFNLTAGAAQLPRAKIESPKEGDTVSGDIFVSGWALADTLRVTAVDILIDGITYGPASYGRSRTDICRGLTPTPPNCPAVGFTLALATQDGFPLLTDGQHTMKVRVLDQTGRYTIVDDSAVTFTVNNGPDAKIVAVLLAPKNNDKLSGTVTVSGYAYSPDHKILEADIYIDGAYYASAKLNQPAPDVCASLTDVPQCPNIGFTYQLDTTHFPNGPHLLGMVIFNDVPQYVIVPHISNIGLNVTIQN